MEAIKKLAAIGLITTTSYLTFIAESTFAVERPAITSIITFACIGLLLIISDKPVSWSRARLKSQRHAQQDYLDNQARHPSILRQLATDLLKLTFSLTTHQLPELLLSILLIFRVLVTRFILQHVECTGPSFATLLPIIISLLTTIWKRFSRPAMIESWKEDHYSEKHIQHTQPGQRSLIIALLLVCSSSTIVTRLFAAPRSTYICASSSPFQWMTPLAQGLALLLDAGCLVCIIQLWQSAHAKTINQARAIRKRAMGTAFLNAAGLLLIAGLAHLFLANQLHSLRHISSAYISSAVKVSLLASLLFVSFLTCLHQYGWIIATAIPVIASVYTSTLATSTAYHPATINASSTYGLVAVACMSLAFMGLLRLHFSPKKDQTRARHSYISTSFISQLIVLSLVAVHVYYWIAYSPSVYTDPIEVLITSKNAEHAAFAASANASQSLYQSVEAYRERYGRYPPPKFDVWHKYATSRKAVVVDAFDSIWKGLLPFYALDPKEIRTRTKELLENDWNDVTGVSIRDGRAYLGIHPPSTNRWMIEGMVDMINQFAEHLPDMDLAFNIHEHSRVVVPYDRLAFLRDSSLKVDDQSKPTNHFQPGRATHWPRIEPKGNSIMQELTAQDSVFRYSTAGCPPDALARNRHYWNVGTSCTACAVGDVGYLPDDWDNIFDVCSQPDLQSLHGQYLGTSAFKLTHKLYPVFSHSKLPGFNDILYPGAWDYLEKSSYAPTKEHADFDWNTKASDLFWRGSTTEGLSDGTGSPVWQGMLRQRFVHMANNLKGSSPPSSVLLPSDQAGEWIYESVPASDLTSMLSTNIQLSPDVTQCRGRDCDVQRWEFAPNPNITHFQDHWAHKYLLDLDGAGPSTRFLPFLRSGSLPFKAGILQEWWNDRVTPWTHFIPLDIRGLAFWTTLGWFAGMDGAVNKRHIKLDAHDAEAKQIAIAGKQWAESALRREDMEIYMFRLLLEWARITDDWRDDIGFTGTST